MHTSKSRSVTNLATAQASQYASTPHLFVFQSSDDAAALEKPAPIYQSAADLRARGQQAAQRITEKYDSYRSLTQKEEEQTLAVQEADIAQVEGFFAGHRTQVIVCRALANMYLSSESNSWELKYTGIPALVVDSGDTRSRGRRQIQLILAEKGSGFMLWRDVVDNLSNYAAPEPSFHTMHLSTDHRQRVGFSFDDTAAAKAFQAQLETLCSDPENIALSGPAQKKRRKKKVERYVRPRKEDISQPCCFQHVTSVSVADRERLFTLQSLVGGGGKTA